MPLTGPQIGRIKDAILDGFDRASFDIFLLTRLDKNRDQIISGPNFEYDVVKVLQRASQENWEIPLLEELRASRPHLTQAFEVAVEVGRAPALPERDFLQRRLRDDAPDVEIEEWLRRFARVMYRVCQITYRVPAGEVSGTGFLVGPSTVLTNRHVVSRVIDGQCHPQDVALVFDFRRPESGLAPRPGSVHRLAADWLLDSSPHHALDTDPGADPDAARPEDAMDHALLRLDEALGSRPIGKDEPGSELRGWIHASPAAPLPGAGRSVYILQHPDGQPLKLAEPNVVTGINSNSTRVRYRVNTEGGSSGSPVFDARLQLVALHHAGDPNFDELHRPEYNQGVPIQVIVQLLEKRALQQWLGDKSEGEGNR